MSKIYNIKALKENINNIHIDDLLCLSVRYNYLDGIKTAIKRGGNINTNNGLPILNAVEDNNFEIVKFLIDNNVDLNNCKFNLVNIALINENIEIAKLLLNHKCIFDNDFQHVCLNNSIYSKRIKTIKFLLEYGVDVNYNKSNLSNIFDAAYYTKNFEIIKLIVMYGYDINKINDEKLKEKLKISLRNEKLNKLCINIKN